MGKLAILRKCYLLFQPGNDRIRLDPAYFVLTSDEARDCFTSRSTKGRVFDMDLEIFLPVYNEGESIEATIREIYAELSKGLRVGFIVCEDGSTDDTKEVLCRLARELPLRLNLSETRRGYSRAVRDGMEMLEAEYLLCLDSDGQCDPKDFWRLWQARRSAGLVMGWRVDRQDTFLRKLFSRFFYCMYEAMFHVPVHDPSCPYMLMHKSTVSTVREELGVMKQGFWWEFVARVHGNGILIQELPVHHRLRSAGVTQVYKWNKMPGIFVRHVAALFIIRMESRKAELGRTSEASPSTS